VAAALGVFGTLVVGQSWAVAQPASPGYERASRSPTAIFPLVETLWDAQWREIVRGPREVPVREAPYPLATGAGDDADHLLPGVVQSEIVPSASGLPGVRAFALPPPDPPRSPPPDLQFDTLGYTGGIPPDDALAAGPTHLVSAANARVQVTTLSGTRISNTSFNNFFPSESTRGMFDPRCVYDAGAGRFILLVIGRKTTAPLASTCSLAVSATSDPTGTWFKYSFDAGRGGSPPTEWADYPSVGYDSTAIYISFNMFTFGQNQGTGNRLVILDKSRLLSGQPLAGVTLDNITLPSPPFAATAAAFSIKPVEAASPASSGLMVSRAGVIGLALFQIRDPLGLQGRPVITSSFVDTTDFASPGPAAQPGSLPALDGGDTRLHKTVYRNGVIWTCHTVSSTGGDGGKGQINIYRIDPNGAGTLLRAMTIVDPSLALYYPAVVPDDAGDAIVIFEGSDATHFVTMFIARYNAARGTLETPTVVDTGLSAHAVLDSSGRNRWGDYEDASLDVVSGIHVWVQGMLPIATDQWQMRVAKVAASPPAAPATLTAMPVSPTQINLAWTNSSVGVSGFKIERKNADGSFSTLAGVGANVTTYPDSGLNSGTSYTYRVRSANAAGESASANEANATTLLPSLNALDLSPVVVPGGAATTGTVTLNAPAPPGGAIVSLGSRDTSMAGVPASVTLPAGSSSQSFAITTSAVAASASATITAGYNGLTRSATLTVRPVGVALMVLAPNPVAGGNVVTGILLLEAPAGPGTISASLASSNTAIAGPASSTISFLPGTLSQIFVVTTSPGAVGTANITASANNTSIASSLTVTP
jgi:hypothetical protein